jgi:NADH-quinone oxidoreductase subunit F
MGKVRLLPVAPYSSYDAYRAAVGSSAVDVARSQTPEAVLALLRASGLRGRGGAGFPTGTKWTTVARHACKTRYVVCNAAEGEPGTFKDRYLLRRNPYAMIEGLLIAAHAVGARRLYIAAKASFVPELERIRAAIGEMRDLIADLSVNVVEGPEEYLFGEEKALLQVIEGEPPMPRSPDSPPYEVGLFAKPGSPNPAVVNNVETYSHVASILRHGVDAWRQSGSADTPGTLLVTLSGDIARPGVYEVEAGVTMRHLLDEVGGGPRPGRSYKAVLSGVSTAPLLPEQLDTHVDFGSMQMVGAGLGSAGFMVVDDATSMPRVAQAIARFLYVESCNQCSACKAGLRTASRALDELFDPEMATPDDPERALFGAASAPQGNRCYLPVQGSILLPALMRRFSSEFTDQIAHAAAPVAEWVVPKIVDFDEQSRTFTYDPKQPLKEPDWTYRDPSPHVPAPIVPTPPPTGPVAVRISADLAARLHTIADEDGLDMDRLVEAALREWLQKQA